MSIFLGLDSSTQGLKAVLIDLEKGEITGGEAVNFGEELPEYRSPSGFLPDPDPLIRQADPRMWLAALDLLFRKLQEAGIRLDQVAGISGSGQQHGSVYLNARFPELLRNLDPARPLADQLAPVLSRKRSPIWMDRSTRAECDELEQRFGDRLQRDTGSPAIERFTGPQIRRFWKSEPEAYAQTAYVQLVSSFLASVLAGCVAPVDYGDGAGMNLLNLRTLDWDPEIAEFTAPDLLRKLPRAVPGATVVGGLAPYFTRYGFRAGTPVTAWTGDNPASLIGTGAGMPGTAVISLGTSDTFFGAMADYKTDPAGCGHVFGNPAGGFMSLICFTNGSLAREHVREECGVDWTFFDETSIELTPPGNHGKLMLPYFAPESTPLVLAPRVRCNFDPAAARPEEKIRCLLESQALSMALHAGWMGERFTRLRITGGASNSRALRRILADVFQTPVERLAIRDSAALGAALMTAHTVTAIPLAELAATFCAARDVTEPDRSRQELYEAARRHYAELEKEEQKRA